MKKDIKHLVKKVDKIDEKLDIVDKHLAIYNEQLVIHIKSGEAIHQASMKRDQEIEEDLRPIKAHINQVRGALKVIAFLCAASGAIITIQSLLGYK